MNNETISITVNALLWILGAIITIGGATAVISRWIKPYKDLKKTVADKADKTELEEMKKELELLKGYQNTDHKELNTIEKGVEKICKCVLAITDHELTNNSIEKLKKAKDEMQDFLITK